MKKTWACVLAFMMLLPLCALADWAPIPDVMRFEQKTMPREKVREKVYIQRMYPVTALQQVTGEMKSVIDHLADEGRNFLPAGPIKVDSSYLKVGANITRSGQSWMSFLTLARVKHGYEQTYVDFDARVYDMETGKRLTLTDLINPEADWSELQKQVRDRLTAYFPDVQADREQLDRLCSREGIMATPFTITPGSLRFHYRAQVIYPSQAGTMLHVMIPIKSLGEWLTPEGKKQTDNSMYKLIALTFDDGPAHAYSLNVVEALQEHGAQGTFFLVGNQMAQGHYVIAYEHDAGHAIAYHSYDHRTSGNIRPYVHAEWQRFCDELRPVIGVVPKIMRAPGGFEQPYIDENIALPLLHWNMAAGDGSGGSHETTQQFIQQRINAVTGNARHGGVVLMHDLRKACSRYLVPILDYLEKNNFLCVTVQELFDIMGTELEPNSVYYGAAS